MDNIDVVETNDSVDEVLNVPSIDNLCAHVSASVKNNVFTLDNIELDNEDNIEYVIFKIDLDSGWDFYPSSYLCIQNEDKITWHILTMGEVFINREMIGFPENVSVFIKGISEFVGEKQTNAQPLSLPPKKEVEFDFVPSDIDESIVVEDVSGGDSQ